MYTTEQRRPQTPVSQIIEDYASIVSKDESIHTRPAPQSYQLVNVHQPNGSLTTIRRNLSARDSGERRHVIAPTSAPRAAKGACRTVLARSSDGSWRRVQRPIRDSELFMRARNQAIDSAPIARTVSDRSSSIYDDDASRGTMLSTITMVETALAEQQTYQRTRGVQVLGHSANGSSATGASGRSGDIEIGHIDEDEHLERSRRYSACSRRYSAGDYGDAGGHGEGFERDEHSAIHRSRSAHESYNTAGGRAAFREYGPSAPVTLPSPLAAASDAHLGNSPGEAAMKPWLQDLVRVCSYALASCSVVLPTAFVALSIAVIFMRGHPVLSSWSSVEDLVEIAAAIWPIVFATTVAQCFKAGLVLRGIGSSTGRVSGCAKRDLTLPRLEAWCLLVFLVWCLSPIGPLAARNMYGTTQETLKGSRDVLYMDNTGRNQVWDPRSAEMLSPRGRSELIQTIGAKYIRSLSQDNLDAPLNEPFSIYSPTRYTSVGTVVSPKSMKDGGLPHGIRRRDEMAVHNPMGVPEAVALEALNFSMTASAFNFQCGDWTLMTRYLSNHTSSDQISYSASQTLGLSMPAHDDSGAPPTVRFVSLNRKSVSSNTTTLRRRRLGAANLTVDQWEYSSISCSYEQVFYNVPMQCSRDSSGSIKSCNQSGAAQLMPSDGTLKTPLGDFALDFVWSGNLPTTDMTATATEQYIQRGGPTDTRRFIRARDVRNPRFNLSATVSPDEFSQRFGHLFSTWVGLGYCPQCSSDVVANSSSVPANLQPRYKKVSSTVTWSGERVYTVKWAWIVVFMVSTSVMLVAAVGAIVVENMVVAKTAKRKTARRPISKEDIVPLRLPTMCSTVSNGQNSPQWSKAVMQDMNVATGNGHSLGAYG
ncbi:hypothetical protein KVR01_005119 [Diaporthe batatas]|uniref:uncharacterized protein n=1 Tax=Diaporthe batatas TaxID=748121 RepID=UPI001D04282F|nr:uncharacterized protein KVR01_005119 [Diaporthe batatas]KAG8164844.1 hypothetical protein KVR01_005119 [Diaporthe batatas]